MRLAKWGRVFPIAYRINDALNAIWGILPETGLVVFMIGGIVTLLAAILSGSMELLLISMLALALGIPFGVWRDCRG